MFKLCLGGCGGPPQKLTVTGDSPLVTVPTLIPPPPPPEPMTPLEPTLPSQVLIMPKNASAPLVVEAAKIILEPYFYGTLKGMFYFQFTEQLH